MILELFHTGYEEIKNPDVHYGRKNADFGQGFYMSDDGQFAGRWAREQRDREIVVNNYELETEGLLIKSLDRDKSWADYIFNNRAAKDDYLKEYDVIIGPIANDTLYNTFGIITSGYLTREEALKLLTVGPCYKQIVMKSNKAISQLKWKNSTILSHEKAVKFAKMVKDEEEEYQGQISKVMEKF